MPTEAPSVFHASDGAAYEQWLGRWSSRLADPFLDFAKFPDDGELLDVGCGTGSLAMAMAKRWPGRQVIGVDRSPEYISMHSRTEAVSSRPSKPATPARSAVRMGGFPAWQRSSFFCSFQNRCWRYARWRAWRGLAGP
jgi:SAM-dependent methyltransferase